MIYIRANLLALILSIAFSNASLAQDSSATPVSPPTTPETPATPETTAPPTPSVQPTPATQGDVAAQKTQEEEQEEEQKAEAEARKAEAAAKKDAEKKARDADYAKGSQLFQSKKYAEAIKVLQKAASSTADDGEAKILLGYCYYSLKQYPAALKQYHLAAEKGTLVSVRNRAQKLEQTLNSYMRGICPGNCLKPSTPGWRKMNVPGKPDHLVWMVFPYKDTGTRGGSEYWSNDHMGEVIEYVNGRPINKGKCPICRGTGKVSLEK